MQFGNKVKSDRMGCSSFRHRYYFVFACIVSVGMLILVVPFSEVIVQKYNVLPSVLQNDEEKTGLLDDLGSRPLLNGCKELGEEEAVAINKVLLDRRKAFLENLQFRSERFANIAKEAGIEPGGVWKPKDCIPHHQLILVIPYRNRTEQLTYFLPYIHEFLQYQKISYRIIIVEQSEEKKFNRGKLMNVGYVEGLKLDSNQTCFIFHDVDLIPENVLNKFYCYDQPLHLTWYLDAYYNYNLTPGDLFGGAVTMLANHFKLINGFSNSFWGWGGEDDDLLVRIRSKKLNYTRYGPEVSRYRMLKHAKEKPNNLRYFVLWKSKYLASADGLSNLNYTVLDYQFKPLYTWIKVEL